MHTQEIFENQQSPKSLEIDKFPKKFGIENLG